MRTFERSVRSPRLLGWMRGVAAALLAVMLASAPARAADASIAALAGGDGKAVMSGALTGRVVLVVNVASFCTFTPQYADLQTLWERYAPKGLVVVGVPSNQFGGQEPGSDREIRNFCESRYGVTFPILAKQDVNGPQRSPLYQFLVSSGVGGGRDVGWNFEKFLLGRTGRVIGRFPSHVEPDDPRVVAAIEMALASP